jgi:DNA-binding Lrp family transcriptional regulator
MYLLRNSPEKFRSQSAVAEKIGVSSNAVSAWMRSVEVVPQEAQKYVAPSALSGQVPEGKIDYQTAVKVGRSVEESEKQVEVIRKLAEKRLPVKARAEVIRKVALEPKKSIEEVIKEVAEAPFEMDFASEDKQALLSGVKTQTSRIEAPDARVKAGAIVRAMIWEPHVADLRIVSVERKKLRYFDEEDARGEGGYSLEEFKKLWKKTNGEWDENLLVYVIHFERAK